jgi:TonB-linked SusC/RagA family outer membrane protein
VGDVHHSGNVVNRDNVIESSLALKYTVPFIKGLTVQYKYAFDRSFLTLKDFEVPYTFYVGTDPIADKKQSIPEINLNQRSTERTRQTGQATLSYNNTFGDHNISGLLLFENSDYRNDWMEAYRDGFISSEVDQLFAGSTARWSNDGSASENARIGYAGRVAYNYKNKYLVQVNGRYDKSFNFPKDNAGGFFPAVSVGWRLSQESFLEDVSWLSNLKLRATWGVYGNDRINPYQYLSLFEFSENRNRPSGTVTSGGYNQGIAPGVIPNPEVTWELANLTNIGFDFALFENKISGDFEVFKKHTEGLLIARQDIPREVGASIAPYNIGIVDNRGLEATLRYKNSFGDFRMNLEGTFTYATSEIIEMSEPANVSDALKETGRPFDSRYGFISDGLFQSENEVTNGADQSYFGTYQVGDIKYVDIAGPDGSGPDGVIDANDRTYIGRSAMPEINFGFNLYLGYQGFELTASFQGASRYTHRHEPSPFVNNGNGLQTFTEAWTAEEPDARWPRSYLGASGNNGGGSSGDETDYFLHDAWFLKLRTAEFAYNIPQIAVLERIGVKHLRVSVSGSNLLSFSNVDFWDPESSDRGTHPMFYTPMRTIFGGIQVTF